MRGIGSTPIYSASSLRSPLLKKGEALNELEKMISKIVKYGDFTLASGLKTAYYVNIRELIMTPEGAYRIGIEMANMLREHINDFDAVGGPACAGIAVVTATLPEIPISKKAFYVRSETKPYGMGLTIEGSLQDGDRYFMLDDVGTTGRSMWSAIEKVQQHFPDCKCIGVAVVLDREEGALPFFEERSIPFYSLTTISKVTNAPS